MKTGVAAFVIYYAKAERRDEQSYVVENVSQCAASGGSRCSSVRGAQITIENPRNLPLKEERVTLLYTVVCQEVATAFHIRDYKTLEVPLTLILGEGRERYTFDHRDGSGTTYLQKWDETRLASVAVMIAFHHVLSDERFRRVVMKTLKRFESVSPVTVTQAKK
jgi:hypothetical protein